MADTPQAPSGRMDRYARSGIRAIERIIQVEGPSAATMSGLAQLHSLRAIALAGAGACSEALVEIAMAIDHDNRDRQIEETRRELVALMDAMREKAASMGYAVDPRVNPEDLPLVADARRGFAPMTLYQSSRRAVQTRAMARRCGC